MILLWLKIKIKKKLKLILTLKQNLLASGDFFGQNLIRTTFN